MLQLYTLGALDLRRDGGEVRSVLAQPKRLALLAYIAAAWPQQYHSRDRLLGLFWPEADGERARNSLRQALHYLRRSLGADAIVGRADWVGVDPAQFWCDAAAFDEALAAGRLEEALLLYRGDFLPGLFVDEAPEAERWLEEERARRRRAAVEAAETLLERAEAAGDAPAALLWARRAAGLVPYDEAPFRRLAALLQRNGENAAALAVAADFTRRLEGEFGLTPSAETIAVIESLRGPAPAVAPAVAPVAPPAPTLAPPLAANPPRCTTPPADVYGTIFTGAAAPPPVAPAPPLPTGAPPRRRLRPALAAVVVLVALVSAAWFARGRFPVPAAAEVPAIAVLPFANLSGDPDKEYFSDGITEELLNVLAQLPGLRVASRTSSFAYKGKDVDIDSIGRALRVGHVLEGSIRTDDGRVRVTAQLIDAATGYHVWSHAYDRELRDIFAVQDEISRAIVDKLAVQLAPGRAAEPLARAQTEDPEAHALVLRGSHIFAQSTREAYAQAAQYFQQAIDRDPKYARAYTSLAIARMWQANHRYIPLDRGYDEARTLAERARQLDPSLGDPLVVLGWITMTRDWDFAMAEALFARAEQLTPNDRRIPNYRAILLSRLGRIDEAVAAAERVTRIDPTWAGAYYNLAAMYGIAGRYDRSIETYRIALELMPERGSTYQGMSMTYTVAAQYDSAIAYGRAALAALPDDQYALATLGFAYGRAGRTADAQQMLRQLEAQPDVSQYLRALVYAGTGDTGLMFACLERAVSGREDAVPDLPADPAFAPYRRDARMRAIVARIRAL